MQILGVIKQVLDISIGVAGLLLVVRLVLQIFGMRANHPVLRVVVALTTPILSMTDRLLGIPSYPSAYRGQGASRSDMLSIAVALAVVWTARTVIVWVLGLVGYIPLWFARPLDHIGEMLIYVLSFVFDLYGLALLIRILFSWIRVPYGTRVMRFLHTITEPVLGPIRSAFPPLGGFDLSPVVAYMLLWLLRQVVLTMVLWVF